MENDWMDTWVPRLLKGFFGLFALVILAFVACGVAGCFGGCMANYSDGNRAGTVVKFSNKGVAIKSWEGQLNVGGMTTDGDGKMVPNVFEFSVTDPVVVTEVQTAMELGRRVTLHYHQYAVKPVTIDTDYVVDGVK